MCQIASPIGVCVQGLASLLKEFNASKSGPWQVLPLSGWRDYLSQEVRLDARAEALHQLVGFVVHFDNKYGELPFALWLLADDSVLQTTKEKWRDELANRKSCCLPLFASAFKRMCPTHERMTSVEATEVLRVWAKGNLFRRSKVRWDMRLRGIC